MKEYIIKVEDIPGLDGGQKVLETTELIRCKDCEYWKGQENDICGSCERHGGEIGAYWFCFDGERRMGNA